MPINRLPGVYYDENVTYEQSGEGSKIPVFIGKTGNTATQDYKVDGTVIRKFTSYAQINETLENGGIGTENEDGTVPQANELLQTLKEFYQEARLQNSGDVGVARVYVIDVGTGEDYSAWINALKKAKSMLDAQVEVPVGAYMKEFTSTVAGKTVTVREPVLCKKPTSINNTNTVTENPTTTEGETQTTTATETVDDYVTVTEFLSTVYNGANPSDEYGLRDCAKNLDLRYCFITVKGATDSELLGITSKFSESRIGLVEPLLFGKTIARICCTPSNTEPGYFRYRSVDEGEFIPRTKVEMKTLQDGGIIFNRDEFINGNVYPKINLCVATSFVDNPRPADALFHARFNADALLREVFEASYEYVKANETASNIAYLQTKVNKLVNDRVSAEEMVRWDDKTEMGTRLRVEMNSDDPYSIKVTGQLQPVKCTIAIDVTATLRV